MIVKKQARKFVSASAMDAKEVRRFAQKVKVIGLAGTLAQNKQALSRAIADWSRIMMRRIGLVANHSSATAIC